MSEPVYLLMKRGLYYAPNNMGYTGIKERAGRYPKTDASEAHEITAIHEDEAPMFAPSTWDEIKVEYLLGKITELETDKARARKEGSDAAYDDAIALLEQSVMLDDSGKILSDVLRARKALR